MHHKAECALNRAKCEKNCGFEGSGKELRDHDCVKYLKGIITRLQQENSSERLAKVSLKEDHGECQKRIDSLTREIRDLKQQLESKGQETKVFPSLIARISKKQKFFESVAKTENEKLIKENRELRERINRKVNSNNENLMRENHELQKQVEMLKKEKATAKDEVENLKKPKSLENVNADPLDIENDEEKRCSTIKRVSI